MVVRAAMPVHMPLSGRNCSGVLARVSGATGKKRSASCTIIIAGEFSVRKISAGELSPSWTI